MRISRPQGFAQRDASVCMQAKGQRAQHTAQSTEPITHKGSIRYHLDACCELQSRVARNRGAQSLYTSCTDCTVRRTPPQQL